VTFRTGSSGEGVDFGGFAVGEHHSAGAVFGGGDADLFTVHQNRLDSP